MESLAPSDRPMPGSSPPQLRRQQDRAGAREVVSITRDPWFSAYSFPLFRTFIHLINRMAQPITRISWIALRSVITIPLPPLAASLSTPRLRAPIVSLSSNSMTHRDPVRPTLLQRVLYSHSPTSRPFPLVDGLAPTVTSMEYIVSPCPNSRQRRVSTIIRYSTAPSFLPIFATARRALGSTISSLRHGL
jgi:hypothetical protein